MHRDVSATALDGIEPDPDPAARFHQTIAIGRVGIEEIELLANLGGGMADNSDGQVAKGGALTRRAARSQQRQRQQSRLGPDGGRLRGAVRAVAAVERVDIDLRPNDRL